MFCRQRSFVNHEGFHGDVGFGQLVSGHRPAFSDPVLGSDGLFQQPRERLDPCIRVEHSDAAARFWNISLVFKTNGAVMLRAGRMAIGQ
jgi:hypothetical protein